MWDFSFSRALSMVLQTLPFIFLRLIVYLGIAFGYAVTVGVGASIGWLLGRVGGGGAGGAFWGGIIGFVLSSAILYLAREYLLYLVKAAHIAVLVQLLDGKPIPAGQSQIAYGAKVVEAHFAESSVLFAVDQVIKGVLRAITRMLQFVEAFLPIPALQTLINLFNAVLRMSLTYVDEIILAYLIRTHTDNPFESAKDALVLYAQNYRHMLKNAAWMALFLWLSTFVLFLVLLGPAAALLAIFPRAASVWVFVLALIFALALRKALFEPIAIAALMQVYFRTIEGQTPDAAWARAAGVHIGQVPRTGRTGRPLGRRPAPAQACLTRGRPEIVFGRAAF